MLRVAIFASLFALTSTSQCNRDATRDPLEWKWDQGYCYSAPDSFSNRLYDCAVVVLVKPSADDNRQHEPPSQEFVVAKVARVEGASVAKGDTIVVPGRRPAKPDELFLLAGSQDCENPSKKLHWRYIVKVTPNSFDYVAAMPGTYDLHERPSPERLLYFVEHLDSPDLQVQDDAYAEIDHLNYSELKPLAKQLPAAKLRKCVADPNTPPRIVGLCALLLGLCGNEQDADLLAKAVGEPGSEFREHLDDAMIGYLLVAGEKGLAFLEQSRLMRDDVPFSEKFGILQAIEILTSYFDLGGIRRERLQESVRLFLDDTELADLAIHQLSRLRDWRLHDRLVDMYGQEQFNEPRIRRAIVRYMLRSEESARQGAPAADSKQAEIAKACLATLREKDPGPVREVEQFDLRWRDGK